MASRSNARVPCPVKGSARVALYGRLVVTSVAGRIAAQRPARDPGTAPVLRAARSVLRSGHPGTRFLVDGRPPGKRLPAGIEPSKNLVLRRKSTASGRASPPPKKAGGPPLVASPVRWRPGEASPVRLGPSRASVVRAAPGPPPDGRAAGLLHPCADCQAGVLSCGTTSPGELSANDCAAGDLFLDVWRRTSWTSCSFSSPGHLRRRRGSTAGRSPAVPRLAADEVFCRKGCGRVELWS